MAGGVLAVGGGVLAVAGGVLAVYWRFTGGVWQCSGSVLAVSLYIVQPFLALGNIKALSVYMGSGSSFGEFFRVSTSFFDAIRFVICVSLKR